MHKLSLSCISLLIMVAPAWAQLKIKSNGNISVGTTTVDNLYKLRVHCAGGSGCNGSTRGGIYAWGANGNIINYGVRARATGDNNYKNYGVYADAAGSSGYNYGIYARAYNGTYNYGIYARGFGGSSNYAGYFSGNVYVTGSVYENSDARLKTDIRSLRGTGMLAKLMQLEPRRYRYQSMDALSAQGLPAMQLPEGEHLGLLAQEVEQVFPEVVTEVAHPVEEGEARERSEAVTTKAINYTELIPVLIEAIQEQQAEIEALKTQLNALAGQQR